MAVWSITNTVEISKNKRFDSEFFHPDYLTSENKVGSVGTTKKLGELGRFLIGPFGSAFHVSNYDSTSEYRYIRGKDVKPFALLDDDNVYMPEKDYFRLAKYTVVPNDLLISVVGTLGNVAIVPDNIKGIFSCKSTIFRESTIDPYYLLAYFNSKYGRDCLLRRQRGAIQAGLNKDDLKTVPVPIFSSEEHETVGNLIRSSLELLDKSKSLYAEAKKNLEKELGLDQLVLEKSKSYETSFSDVVGNSRADADYFQTHFIQQARHIKSIPTKPLMQIVDFTKGIEVGSHNYTNSGKLFIRVSNVKENAIVTGNSDKYISDDLYNSSQLYKPNIGDILLTKDGTLGVCYVIDTEIEGIISSGIMKMRLKDSLIPAEYLSLVINSKACRFQIERACSGALILHWKPKDIVNLSIPILKKDTMHQLAELVIQSKQAKKESEQLIEKAKKKVESLIEGAI
ncbi:hypothetical protein COK52_23095 [Bacillus thuringiensis]|nr:hypothetical protein COK52_23095 [Bacillus thuringiensis]